MRPGPGGRGAAWYGRGPDAHPREPPTHSSPARAAGRGGVGEHASTPQERPSEMNEPLFDPLLALGTLLNHEVRFVLIGGFAGALRGSPVVTGDIDVCYARDGENLERLAVALGSLDARLGGESPDVPPRLDAQALRAGDHFTFTTSAGPVDILGTPAGTKGFADLDGAATDEVVDGLTIRVASIEDLIRMKRASGRAKDRIELEWLSAVRDESNGP